MTDPFDSLTTLEDHIWARLRAGAAQATDPFRYVVLATCGAAGAEARTVGLRAACRDTRQIEVHSDLRTDKVRALDIDPRVTLLFWDARIQVQLRVMAQLSVTVGDPSRWAQVPEGSRGNYGTSPAPGTAIPSATAYTRDPDPAHFAVLSGAVNRFDIVSLAHTPHRRAQFDVPANTATWCVP